LPHRKIYGAKDESGLPHRKTYGAKYESCARTFVELCARGMMGEKDTDMLSARAAAVRNG